MFMEDRDKSSERLVAMLAESDKADVRLEPRDDEDDQSHYAVWVQIGAFKRGFRWKRQQADTKAKLNRLVESAHVIRHRHVMAAYRICQVVEETEALANKPKLKLRK